MFDENTKQPTTYTHTGLVMKIMKQFSYYRELNLGTQDVALGLSRASILESFTLSLNGLTRVRKFSSARVPFNLQQIKQRIQKQLSGSTETKVDIQSEYKELMDDLRYAGALQNDLLAPKYRLKQNFKEAFVHYAPKNIVGGDFIWLRENHFQGDQNVYFALGDCTGHGVSGAMLSVLGINTLDEIMSMRIHQPAALMNQMRKLTTRRLNKHQNRRLDGMDLGLVRINKNTKQLTFVGAQIPLWILRNGNLVEFKGQRIPIGYSYGPSEPFTETHINLEDGDKLLFFTDGIFDQFGEFTGKKLGKKNLRLLIHENKEQSTKELYRTILNYFNNWKGKNEQTDDCTFAIIEPF